MATSSPSPPLKEDNVEKGSTSSNSGDLAPIEHLATNRDDGKVQLPRVYCEEKLAFALSNSKKWGILTVIFIVQMSMNFNASFYGNAVPGMMERFGISGAQARLGQCLFLIAYGFGSEFWAPWSEQYGRRRVMQLSLLFVNIWQIPCALAPNMGTVIAFRVLGGLSSAGGSVTLGMVADLYDIHDHQYALNYIVLSSVSGSAIGPIFGSFVEKYLEWRWVFWLQLLFGAAVQLLHLVAVPETRETSLIDKEARRLRKEDPQKYGLIYGPGELDPKMDMRQIFKIWYRPFKMFFKEPIVLFLSLLSGFSDALIFSFIDSFHDVFAQWHFGTIELGLTFVAIIIGYLICFLAFLPDIRRQKGIHDKDPSRPTAEARLWLLRYLAPLLPFGLLCFTLTTTFGPPMIHWIGPLICASIIAVANYAIYMATVDYMVRAYGEYSASATGGNALARDVLAGFAALYSAPLYQKLGQGKMRLFWPSLILTILATLVTMPVYIIYTFGPAIRARSPFAQTIAEQRNELDEVTHRSHSVADVAQIQVNVASRARARDFGIKEGQAPHTPAASLFDRRPEMANVSARQY